MTLNFNSDQMLQLESLQYEKLIGKLVEMIETVSPCLAFGAPVGLLRALAVEAIMLALEWKLVSERAAATMLLLQLQHGLDFCNLEWAGLVFSKYERENEMLDFLLAASTESLVSGVQTGRPIMTALDLTTIGR